MSSQPKQVEINLYEPHANQLKIREDNHRFKIVVCGRRFGKTVFAINELLYHALLTPKGRFWYVAPTYSQAKMIAWRMLLDKLKELPPELVRKKNESELYVEVGNGAIIELKGAENEDALRGTGLHGIVCDEYATMKPHVFDEILRPALTDYKGWGIFIGTPKGFNHFHELFKRGSGHFEPGREGEGSGDGEFKSFHFTTYDNPHLSAEEIEAARQGIGEELFAQEYLAEFTRFTGAIYKEFNPVYHIMDEWKPEPGAVVYRAMDFGAINPTVCLWIHVNNQGEVIVFDEYYQTEQTTMHHAGMILSRHSEYSYARTFGDPSGVQEMQDYAQHGLFITPAVKNVTNGLDWVVSGINEIKALMKVRPQVQRPGLFITRNCSRLLKELQGYRWVDPPKRLDQPQRDVPVKVDDHGPDALRYFVVSFRPSQHSRRRKAKRPVIHRQRSSVTGY